MWNPFVDTNPPPRFPAHELRFLKSLSPPSPRRADPGVLPREVVDEEVSRGPFGVTPFFGHEEKSHEEVSCRGPFRATAFRSHEEVSRGPFRGTAFQTRSTSTAPDGTHKCRVESPAKCARRVGHSNISSEIFTACGPQQHFASPGSGVTRPNSPVREAARFCWSFY